jgi:hypothetical protein
MTWNCVASSIDSLLLKRTPFGDVSTEVTVSTVITQGELWGKQVYDWATIQEPRTSHYEKRC